MTSSDKTTNSAIIQSKNQLLNRQELETKHNVELRGATIIQLEFLLINLSHCIIITYTRVGRNLTGVILTNKRYLDKNVKIQPILVYKVLTLYMFKPENILPQPFLHVIIKKNRHYIWCFDKLTPLPSTYHTVGADPSLFQIQTKLISCLFVNGAGKEVTGLFLIRTKK